MTRAARQVMSMMEDNPRTLSLSLGLPVVDDLSQQFCIPKETLKKIPYGFAKKHKVIPFKQEEGVIYVASSDPFNLDPFEELRSILNSEIKVAYADAEAIDAAIHESYNKEEGEASHEIRELHETLNDKGDSEVQVYDLLDDANQQAPIIKILNLILSEAIQQGASDIHFEPFDGSMRIRYRIDGVLQNRHAPAQEFQHPLISRLKVMSRLDIAEHRLPQDGRIKLRMGRREIDFRVSTVPVQGGERIVLRILDKGNVVLGLDKIGMPVELLNEFRKMSNLPEGIVLVTGPTGSGKTTTLYSAISDLHNEEINIMTIEDPVEYNLKGIAQIGVQPKIHLDFAKGLRHILRQDPDVIMIGEIRDVETAQIAIQSSLTGHLVMSTLHTNDAPSAMTRLVDMGVEPYLLSSTVAGVLAQRLVRRICKDCAKDYLPTKEEAQTLGISIRPLKIGKGCSSCFNTGYKGRHGIYELMVISPALQKQIVKSPDAVEMRRVAMEGGMKSLLEHGQDLVVRGITTIAEVLRVTRGFDS